MAASSASEREIRELVRAVAASDAVDGEHGAGIVEEFWIPNAHTRADVASVGAELCAYEIKSAADTLRRLPAQIESFSRIFDRCTVVLAQRHVEAAEEMLPTWWGVIEVVDDENGPSLFERKASGDNPSVDLELLVRLLWRREVENVLRAYGEEPDVKRGRIAMWKQLLSCAPGHGIQSAVRDAIARREDTWVGGSGLQRVALNCSAVPEPT
ncbi:MAG: sce7726 family protein [Solirubrobacteraceae bacterium]|nr:sce7726 family protein [Patulibacter sp.]